jgi:ABC-type transporter Mla subunit MlaD
LALLVNREDRDLSGAVDAIENLGSAVADQVEGTVSDVAGTVENVIEAAEQRAEAAEQTAEQIAQSVLHNALVQRIDSALGELDTWKTDLLTRFEGVVADGLQMRSELNELRETLSQVDRTAATAAGAVAATVHSIPESLKEAPGEVLETVLPADNIPDPAATLAVPAVPETAKRKRWI